MKGYEQVIMGVPFTVKTGKGTLHLRCCDCGLVHVVDLKIVKNKIQMIFRVDNRKTAAVRRHNGIEGSATCFGNG